MINRLVRLSRVVSSRLPREFKTNCEMLVIIEGKGPGMDGWMDDEGGLSRIRLTLIMP